MFTYRFLRNWGLLSSVFKDRANEFGYASSVSNRDIRSEEARKKFLPQDFPLYPKIKILYFNAV